VSVGRLAGTARPAGGLLGELYRTKRRHLVTLERLAGHLAFEAGLAVGLLAWIAGRLVAWW
jgi:hypothetical protein